MSKNAGGQLIRIFFILLLFFVSQNSGVLAQSLPVTSSGTSAPTVLTTYLAPYGTPLINYPSPIITLPVRAYDPNPSGSGASEVTSLITYLTDSFGIIDYSIVLVKSGTSSYQLVMYDWINGVAAPWPLAQILPNGQIQPSGITLSGLEITATQLILAGNEMQFNVSLNRSGLFDTYVTLAATDPTSYSLPWSETVVGEWMVSVPPQTFTSLYTNRGIGGGGATYAVSFQPASTLAYIASENGTLFRSVDNGGTWQALDQFQLNPGPYFQLNYVGFTADPNIAFWVNNDLSSVGYSGYPLNASRSLDQGITWIPMNLPLLQNGIAEHVLYWTADFSNNSSALCATDKGLLITHDDGETWTRANLPSGRSQGTFVDVFNGIHVIYHALNGVIYRSIDGGQTFHSYYSPSTGALRHFAGAHDTRGLTLAYADNNGASACAWAATPHFKGWDPNPLDTQKDCGYIWVSRNGEAFTQSSMIVGDYLKMADNDSQTIYAVGGQKLDLWIGQFRIRISGRRQIF